MASSYPSLELFTHQPPLELQELPATLPNVIVIDGPSGTGKTTTARLLAEVLKEAGNTIFISEEGDLDPNREQLTNIIRETQDTRIIDIELTRLFTEHRSDSIYPEICSLSSNFDLVIIVRGEITTAAYQTARGVLTIENVFISHRSKNVPLPGTFVILNLDTTSAIERIGLDTQRDESHKDKLGGKVTQDLHHRQAIHSQYTRCVEFYRHHCKNTAIVCIETKELSLFDVVKQVLLFLNDYDMITQETFDTAEQILSRHEGVKITDPVPMIKQLEQKLTYLTFPLLEKGRPDFDLPHTKMTVHYMKQILQDHPDINPMVLITAAYFHDIGYTGMFQGNIASYKETIQKKDEHMRQGAKLAREILEGQLYDFFEPAAIDQIVLLVQDHDNVESCINTDEGLVLMEADTLGAFHIAALSPTFSKRELTAYLKKNIRRRVSRFRSPIAQHIAKTLIIDIRKQIEDMV